MNFSKYILFLFIFSKTKDGRLPILLFMEKPSKKFFPDYYEVIQEPMDMLTIESNIRAGKYFSEMELLNDVKVMAG